MVRRFHGVATKNLPNYLGWRRTLEAAGREITAPVIILGAMGRGAISTINATIA